MNSIKNTSTNVSMTAVNMMNVASAADMSMTAITVTTTAVPADAADVPMTTGEEETKLSLTLLGVSAVLVVVGLFLKSIPLAQTIVGIIAVVLAAYPLVFKVYGDIKGRRFTEIELMLVSVVAACCIGELRDAALVAILYRIGEIIEDRAVENSRKAIDSVAKIQQDYAHLVLPDGTTKRLMPKMYPSEQKSTFFPMSVSRLTVLLNQAFQLPTLPPLQVKACRSLSARALRLRAVW